MAIYAFSSGIFPNVRVHACVKDLTDIMSGEETLRKQRVAKPRGLWSVLKTAVVVPILLDCLQDQN